MSPDTQAILSSWSIDPALALGLILAAILYLRGWRVLHRIMPARFPGWAPVAFLAGLIALWLAIASPLDAFSNLLLSAHMIQHLLLMSVAPPLLLLGAPLLPLLRGLPRGFAHDGLGPFLAWPALRRLGGGLTHPVTGWLALALSLCLWHLPPAFDLALRSPAWHKFEHACFFISALLFWWPVVRPFPARAHWPLWTLPLYLLAADILNSALCAILTFSEHSLYSAYQIVPRLFGTTALSDQVAAGVIMWVPGSLVYLVPASLLAIQYLSPANSLVRPRYRALASPGTISGPVLTVQHPAGLARFLAPTPVLATPLHTPLAAICSGASAPVSTSLKRAPQSTTSVAPIPFDLLAQPFIGRFLRSLVGRRILQTLLLVIAVGVMADGFFGPQLSPANLAGVVPWTWWRALTVVGLLAAGNLFCMACPFMLPREIGRRLGLKPRNWPRALRSKWLAVGLLLLFFWAYEAFGLWDKPIWTAWLILNYFLAAFVLDAFFRGASFCKYVCPIGQFQFINSLISPLEVKVRRPAACATCQTHDCLRGNQQHRGCETSLFLPRKAGNLDCTFCLDCVRACPHDNIGLLAVVPGADLVRDPQRSSLGRLSRRIDVAALALVLVFAAFASAAAMTAPVNRFLNEAASQIRFTSSVPVVSSFFTVALVLIPALSLGAAVWCGRVGGRVTAPSWELFCRFSLALVPLGAGMWAAHFLFHFLAGYRATWPLLQQTATGFGLTLGGWPDWSVMGLPIRGEARRVLQTIILDGGLLLSLYVGWRIACSYVSGLSLSSHATRPSALGLFMPWAGVAILLYAIGVWILLQPMQMRGLLPLSM